MSDKYRLKVKRVPLTESVPIVSKPRFPPTDELYLDLIENKDKVRRNAPKPIYVRSSESYSESGGHTGSGHGDSGGHGEDPQIDDFTLEELEKAYGRGDRGSHSDADTDSHTGHTDDEDDHHDHHGHHDNHHSSRDTYHHSSSSHRPTSRRDIPEPSRSQPESYAKSAEFEADPVEEEDPEVVERREKSEYLVKFMILRKHYPELDIPEFSEHSDLKSMKMAYEHAFRLTSLDESVAQYRMYIYGSSMALEWVSTNWFGFDMSGFAKAQEKSVSKYDRLLFELGEKNYSPEGSRFPVEVRLLFMMLVQAAFFAFTKAQQNSSGISASASIPKTTTVVDPVPSFGGSLTSQRKPAAKAAAPRTRMRGPTIKPEDLREQESPGDDSDDDNGKRKGD